MRGCFILATCLSVMGCTEFPDIPISDPDALAKPDYPTLVNLRTLELNAAELEAQDLEAEAEEAARFANLRARAAELRQRQFD